MTIRVSIPGIAWDTFEGTGLVQVEQPEIVDRFRRVKRGFGVSFVADLPKVDAEYICRILDSYGTNLTYYSDIEARSEGRAMLKAAAKLREAIDADH